MTLKKNAIGNLVSRYMAELKKCNLINDFGSLAVTSTLVLGGAGMSSVYAAGELHGGTLDGSGSVYTGDGPNHEVDINGSAGTPPVPLVSNMQIYGMKGGTTVTGSVTAKDFDSSTTVTGLKIWGGWSDVAGVVINGINNKVEWNDSAKVKNIKKIAGFEAGFEASANEVSATGTKVTLTGAKIANEGEVYGAHVKSTSGTATATGTEVKLTGTKPSNPSWDSFTVSGAYVVSDSGTATATDTQVTLTETELGSPGGATEYIHGAYVKSASGEAMATGTTLTLTDTTKGGNSIICGAKVEGKTSATATDTKVNMTGGRASELNGVEVGVDDAAGKAEATGTTLTINGAILEYKVRGAFVKGKKDGKASDTKITMTGGQLHNTFNAAEVQANEAGSIGETNNTTLIIDNTRLTISDDDGIVGAHVSANAGGEILSTKNTTVKLLNLISTDEVGKELIGAHVSGDTGHVVQLASAKADTTEVEMKGGKVQNVVGAMFYHTELAEAKDTTVTLNKVEAGTVIGVNVTEKEGGATPIAKNATANDTTVTVTDTTVNGAIRGVNVAAVTSGNPEAETVTANNTKLTIKGTTVDGDVTGVRGKATDTITATNTDVIIDGATLADSRLVYGAHVESASGNATATDTQVTLTNTEIGVGNVIHGAHVNSNSGKVMATGTTLTLNNITTEGNNNILGAKVEGTTSATATGTTVNMTGGVVKANTFHGVEVGDQSTNKAEATGTTLTINDAILDGKVRGALVYGTKDVKASDTKITMTGGEINELFNAAEVHANGKDSIGQANNTTLIINGTKIRTDAVHIQGAEVTANAGEEILSAKNTIVKLLNLTDADTMGNLIGVLVSGDTGFGHQLASAKADTTEVEMNGGKVQNVVGAMFYHTELAEAKDTTVTLNKVEADTVIGVNVTEGGTPTPIAKNATANDTTVTVTGTTVNGAIRGVNVAAVTSGNPEAKTVTANNTKLTINDTTVGGDVTGVRVKATDTITATNTDVIIDGATLPNHGKVYGAYVESASGNATATGTKVTLTGTKVDGDPDGDGFSVYGAHVSGDTGHVVQLASAKADTTEVEMNGGKVQNVVGAMFYHTELAEAKNTTVTLNKVEAGTVIGVNVTESEGGATPIAKNATANDTTVTVTGTTVNDAIRGVNVAAVTSGNPEAKTVTANNTKLTIKDTTVGGDVTGVRVKATDTITATNTDVIIDGATLIKKSVYGVDFVGDGTATNTAVTINAGEIKESVYGVNIDGVGIATNTAVTINAGEIKKSVYGVDIVGDGTATNTAVTINAGEIKESVYGVNIDGDGTAKNNTVTINNGTITGSVYGVNIKNGAAGTAANNTVIYSGGEIERDLRGGVAANSLNNTLVVIGENRKVGGSVSHFQNYRFLLPADVANNAKILEVGTSADINGANVNVEFMGTPFRLKKGDSVTLINKTTGTYIGDSFYFLPYGFLSTYDFNIAVDSSDTGLKMMLDAVTKKSDNPYATNGDGLDDYIKASQDRGEIHPAFSTDLSKPAGVRFLSRAIDPAFGNASTGAAKAVESAMNAITVAAVPQITMSANMAAVGAVTQRTSIAMPLGSMQSATLVSDAGDQSGISGGNKYDKTGFAIWIMPLWQSNKTFGMKVGDNLKTDTRASMDGIAIGADYTWDQMFRLGLTLNIGSDHAKGSGDFAKTTNNMNFWGIGAYAGWAYNNFGLTADVNYTSANNKIKQEIDSSFSMDEMKADARSSAISAGLRGEYKFETSALDITPHVGVRFMYLTTDDYNMKSGGETVLKADSTHQNIWTFPVGVQFAKSFDMDNGWYVKPSLDLTFIPAAGDINSKRDVRFTGVSGTLSPEAKIMDRVSYGGLAGLELGNGNMKLGVIYNLQLSAHSTNHGVSGTLRYEF